MASHLFLISYILDDQPMTCELHSEADTLSREEARRHLEALHRPHDAEAISDIQVSKVERTHEPGTTPGHYQPVSYTHLRAHETGAYLVC
ncbi:hypothetical protein FA391_16005, partial [Pseudomonas aeruginosa]|nr:hypothetical protein [Pseudomonas aeruginosa]